MSAHLPTLSNGLGNNDTVSALTFADARDGWLYGNSLWSTHDGGRHWRHVAMPGGVEQLGVSKDAVWAIVGSCRSDHVCSSYQLMRASGTSDRFAIVPLPVLLGREGAPAALGVRGSTVAVLNTLRPSHRDDSADLEMSVDGGTTWSNTPAPCYRELGGQLSPAGAAIWGVCPTGMLAFAYRFAAGRFTIQNPAARSIPNASSITGLTTRAAVVSVPLNHTFWTADRGTIWHSSHLPRTSRSWYLGDVSFSGPRVGYGIYRSSASTLLVRTSNAGHNWTVIHRC